MKKKVCVITGSRAEYGLLRDVLQGIQQSKKLNLLLVVTGTHLSKEFGYTANEIVQDGFIINESVEMLLASDSSVSIGKSIGLGIISFAECLNRLDPDIILIVGDRFEIFAVASAAMINNIPIAHISGGEITEGAIDEQIRHAITKMSHLHFTTAEENSEKVRQIGEESWRVHTVGGLWVDNVQKLKRKSRDSLRKELGIRLIYPTIIVTFHPVTLELDEVEFQINNLLGSLEKIDAEIIFTFPNSDAGGQTIISKIEEFLRKYPNSKAFRSLGRELYLNLLSNVDLMVGNSSSGVVETQSFKLPVVNIGDRQKGRLITENIICSTIKKENILQSIKKGLSREFRQEIKNMKDPYGRGGAAKKIVSVLNKLPKKNVLLRKKFISIS